MNRDKITRIWNKEKFSRIAEENQGPIWGSWPTEPNEYGLALLPPAAFSCVGGCRCRIWKELAQVAVSLSIRKWERQGSCMSKKIVDNNRSWNLISIRRISSSDCRTGKERKDPRMGSSYGIQGRWVGRILPPHCMVVVGILSSWSESSPSQPGSWRVEETERSGRGEEAQLPPLFKGCFPVVTWPFFLTFHWPELVTWLLLSRESLGKKSIPKTNK